MQGAIKQRERNGVMLAVFAGCIATVLAQFIEIFTWAFFLIWLSLALYLLVKHRDELRFAGRFGFISGTVFLFSLYCLLCSLISGQLGYITGFLIIVAKSYLMYLVGYAIFVSRLSPKQWKPILTFYCVSVLVYVAWAFCNYFPGLSAWLSSMTYLFPAKNSFGQIAGVAAIVCFCGGLASEKNKFRILLMIAAAVFSASVLFLQCRTAFLGIIVALLAYLVLTNKKKILLFIVVFAILVIALSPTVQSYLTHAFFLDKYASADANTLSSGRLDFWVSALESVADSNAYFFGLGSYYVDCFYINAYANVGIVGLLILLVLLFARFYGNVTIARCREDGHAGFGPIRTCLLALTFFYFIESFLEGQPPFGPGTCSFLFWMLSGYVDGSSSDTYNIKGTSRQ